jgi:hypothetical protein
VDQPSSSYQNDSSVLGGDVSYPGVTHGLYSLLQVLFRDSDAGDDEMEGKIIQSLRCEGYTRDLLDYRAVYLVLVLLECMGIAAPDTSYACSIRKHFITQLISEGYWLWAVFVALQISDDVSRGIIVKEMIFRYAVIDGDFEGIIDSNEIFDYSRLRSLKCCNNSDQAYFLVNILKVPLSWLHESAAYRYGYSCNYFKQVQHLNFAKLWLPAKEIVCTKLAPMILLKSSVASHSLLLLLESMDLGAVQEDMWSSRSDILLSFLRLKSHVENVVKIYGMENMFDRNVVDRLEDIVVEAKQLLERVQILNTINNKLLSRTSKSRVNPTIEHATLLNMGTYLFDLIDKLTWRGNESFQEDLYDSVRLFESCLSDEFPVQNDHILHSLNNHSSELLKEAANRLSHSYHVSDDAYEMTMMAIE